MEASASSASDSASSMATRQLLDRCYRHLEAQGFGPLELVTLEINNSDDIAQQLAFLLSLPYSEAIVEALAICIQDVRGKTRLLWRSHGLLADDLVWHQLAPVRDGGPVCVEEARPPPGDKAKKLITDGVRS